MKKIYQKPFPGAKNAGFTLIELLVVVLIIGILSAVALPQYQKAVENAFVKSQIFPKLRAACQAQQAYILANGRMTDDFRKLDMDILPGCSVNERGNLVNCRKNGKNFNFYMTAGNGNVASHYKKVAFDAFFLHGPLRPCEIYCRGNSQDDESHLFCSRFGKPIASGSRYYQLY